MNTTNEGSFFALIGRIIKTSITVLLFPVSEVVTKMYSMFDNIRSLFEIKSSDNQKSTVVS